MNIIVDGNNKEGLWSFVMCQVKSFIYRILFNFFSSIGNYYYFYLMDEKVKV